MPRKYSEECRAKLCEEWKKSELSKETFSRQRNVSVSSLNLWLRKEKLKKQSEAKIPIKFLPIKNSQIHHAQISSSKTQRQNYFEMLLPNGIAIKLTLEANDILKLIKELL